MNRRLALQKMPPLVWQFVIPLLCVLLTHERCAAQSVPVDRSLMEQRLQQRIAIRPNDATNWRLLGRIRLEQNDINGAINACTHAVQLAPHSASAHFDSARVWIAAEDFQRAAYHFQQAAAIAPDSDYAHEAVHFLADYRQSTSVAAAAALDADLEPNRFVGTPLISSAGADERRLDFRLDFGALYNSNVQLAPVSRVVSSPGLGSAQGFIAPHLEYRYVNNDFWRSGLSFNGYFSANESHLDKFNLQDYQPGAFYERSFYHDDGQWVVRLQYDFTLDQFAGRTFGKRHALTAAVTMSDAEGVSVVYWTIDYSDFTDDGGDPAVTSLDGWTNTLGFSDATYTDIWLLDLLRAGVDVQLAPLRGDDYAYRGVFVYTEAEIACPWQSLLVLQLGWGYRDYPDFTGTPSRNEHIWRAGVELSKELNEHWSVTGLLAFDRFATDNVLFDTNRYLTGFMASYRY